MHVQNIKKISVKPILIFPIILTLILIFLTLFKISGTSIGTYETTVNGKSSNVIYGTPRAVRSDEWLVNTQLIIAQEREDYPRVNNNLGNGKDMSLIVDVPYKDWSVLFKPQNLAFFILPLEYAFAFKWWLLIYLLMISVYIFSYRLLGKIKHRTLISVLMSVSVGLSPFIFWWYQSITIMPLVYAFLVMYLIDKLLNKDILINNKISGPIYTLLLFYILTSFILILYPPFQISIILVILAFTLSNVLEKTSFKNHWFKDVLLKLLPLIIGSIISILVLTLFIYTRYDSIQSVMGSSHPGTRVIKGGSVKPIAILSGYLMPHLQKPDSLGKTFITNPSEDSNFILLLPFLLIPTIAIVIYQYKKAKYINWYLAIYGFLSIFLIIRMTTGLVDWLPKILLFDKIPNGRFIIALGLLGTLQLITLLSDKSKYVATRNVKYFISAYSILTLVFLITLGKIIKNHYPLLLANKYEVILPALVFSLMIYLILVKKKILFCIVLVAFSILSTYKIHPLYKGLGFANNNNIYKMIKENTDNNDTVSVADNIIFENLGLLSDRKSYSGIQIYPDNSIWNQFNEEDSYKIYNRYAHVIYSTQDKNPDGKFKLIQNNLFSVDIDCDSVTKNTVDYFIIGSKVDFPCLQLVDATYFPNNTFFLYEVIGAPINAQSD